MATERKVWFAAAKKGIVDELKEAIRDASFAKEKNFAIKDELGLYNQAIHHAIQQACHVFFAMF